jgi:septum site-determining protein MinC
MAPPQSGKPLEIKISTVVAVAAILHRSDPAALRAALQQMTGGVADYFDGEFAVLDVGALNAKAGPPDWPALVALFKSQRLNPVAVRNAPPDWEAGIREHGLSVDVVARPRAHEEAAPASEPPPQPAATAPAPRRTLIVDTPVRGGQRVYARDADLVVTAVVNNGAEIIADGNIHVYAPLRGRALAGASGDAGARIFALGMEAELVSIAGIYRMFEDGVPAAATGRPAQVRLNGNRIEVEPIKPAHGAARN